MKIYMYTTATYREKGFFKIGETMRDVTSRIKEQDTTSNPEKLIKCMEWEVVGPITDKLIHDYLEFLGYKKTRSDVSREWFIIDDPFPEDIVYSALVSVNIKINGYQYPVYADREWLCEYEQRKTNKKYPSKLKRKWPETLEEHRQRRTEERLRRESTYSFEPRNFKIIE